MTPRIPCPPDVVHAAKVIASVAEAAEELRTAEPKTAAKSGRIPCPPPDVYPGVPHDVYRSWDAVCQSGLKDMRPTPANYRYLADFPKPETPAMKLGTAFHCYYLDGPDEFKRQYAVAPEGVNLSTKEGIAWKKSVEGLKRLSYKDAFDIGGMVQSLIQCKAVDAIVHAPKPNRLNEVSIVWDDAATGLRCKGRLDVIRETPGGWTIIDPKSTEDASPEGFSKSVLERGYHIQEAFYRWGCSSLGLDIERFIFAAVESSSPYLAAPYELDDDFLSLGWREVRRLLDLYAECTRTNTWPGYSPEPVTISPPKWAMKGR